MKKKLFIAAAAIAALAACAALHLRGGKTLTAQLAPLEEDAARDLMRASLTYDEGTRTLRGTQALSAVNRTGEALEEIVLRLTMNGTDGASAAVTNVAVNGEGVSFEQDADDATVLRIAADWQPGERLKLTWTLMLKHPKTNGAAVITLPSLSLWDGGWRTDAYDPLADVTGAQAFDYEIDLIAKDSVKLAFGAALTSCRAETAVDELLWHAQMQGARDVSFALLSGGKMRQKEIGGVLVTALAPAAGQADGLLSGAQEAMESLEKIGLAYPFASLCVAAADTGREDGQAFSGLIALGAQDNKEALLRRMTRLIAQETFGVLVGCDAYGAPWLSRTLASAAELLAYRQRAGEGAYETRFFEEIEVATRLTRPYGVTVGAGVSHFGSDAEMTQVLRDQGAAMLLGIGEAIGYDALTQALVCYAQDNAGQMANRQSLEAALESVSGSSWSGYLDDELSY